jgi:hypothetical protein
LFASLLQLSREGSSLEDVRVRRYFYGRVEISQSRERPQERNLGLFFYLLFNGRKLHLDTSLDTSLCPVVGDVFQVEFKGVCVSPKARFNGELFLFGANSASMGTVLNS